MKTSCWIYGDLDSKIAGASESHESKIDAWLYGIHFSWGYTKC